MPDPVFYRFIRVASAFSSELPYRPILVVLFIEEGNELVQGIAVVAFWVFTRRTGGCNDAVSNVTEIEASFRMSRARTGDYLAEE